KRVFCLLYRERRCRRELLRTPPPWDSESGIICAVEYLIHRSAVSLLHACHCCHLLALPRHGGLRGALSGSVKVSPMEWALPWQWVRLPRPAARPLVMIVVNAVDVDNFVDSHALDLELDAHESIVNLDATARLDSRRAFHELECVAFVPISTADVPLQFDRFIGRNDKMRAVGRILPVHKDLCQDAA